MTRLTSRSGEVALVDVDGVLADFVPALLHRLDSPLTVEDIDCWDFIKEKLTPEERAMTMALLSQDTFWRDLPVCEGAHKLIEQLQAEEARIYIASSPWTSCPNWEGARRDWLLQHFKFKPNQFISIQEKWLLDGDVFIDDKSETVWEWQALHDGRAYIIDRPWNRYMSLRVASARLELTADGVSRC